MSAEAILAAIQSRGSDAVDLRDAVHEATHAIQCRLHGPWQRERIHAALERRAKHSAGKRWLVTEMVRYELQARAVEMLVCERFAVPYDAKNWALWCAMETAKTYRVDLGSLDTLVDAFVLASKQRHTLELLDQVLATKAKRRTARVGAL
jgi:hypothetical protein